MQKEIKINLKKSENYKQIYSTGAIGGHTPHDFRIGFYNEQRNFDLPNQIDRIVENEIILTPLVAVELSNWILKHIEEYEKQFGKINKIIKPIKIEEKNKQIVEGYM